MALSLLILIVLENSMSNPIKLVNAKIVKTSKGNLAHLINVELLDGGNRNVWFPVEVIIIEQINDSANGDIYIDNWFLEKKQEELEEEFVTEIPG